MSIFTLPPRNKSAGVVSADGTASELVTAVAQKWSDGFGGDTLNANKWDRVDIGTPDYTVAVAGGVLTVTAGSVGGEMQLLSKAIFTIPFDLTAVLRDIGTLSATRMLDVDFVEVDDAGTPIANDFLPGDLRNRAGLRIATSTATGWMLAALAGNSPVETALSATSGMPTRINNVDATVAYRAQDTFLTFAPTDSPAAKNAGAIRISSQVPSPNGKYRLRLRFRHAAAQAGAWVISRILVIDNQEIPVTIMSGAGDAVPGNAVPVALTSGDVTIAGANATGATTSLRNPVGIGAFDGTAFRRLLSSAAGFLYGRQPGGEVIVDVASAAKTSSGNSGMIAANGGQTIAGSVVVTAASGTSPTLDLELVETNDNGTSYQVVYDLPRITGPGSFSIPLMTMGGRRRWNWVIGGTSPSFTFAINVSESQAGNAPIIRKLFDRTLNPNAASATPSLNIEGCTTISAQVWLGTAGTTQPSISLQISEDGVNWLGIANFTLAAGQLGSYLNVPSVGARFARLATSSSAPGVGAVLNYVTLEAIG